MRGGSNTARRVRAKLGGVAVRPRQLQRLGSFRTFDLTLHDAADEDTFELTISDGGIDGNPEVWITATGEDGGELSLSVDFRCRDDSGDHQDTQTGIEPSVMFVTSCPGGGFLDDDDSGSATITVSSRTMLLADRWTHIAASYDGSTMKVYVDGALDGDSTCANGAIAASHRPIYIGRELDPPAGRAFRGAIDEARVTLDDLTVRSLFEEGKR